MARRDSDGNTGRAAGKDRDLYAVLGVAKDATADQIKKAYRKLARKYHPDVNPGDKSAEERFKELSRAHDVLSDETQRKNYDEFGDDALQSGFDPAKAREFRRWQQAVRWESCGRQSPRHPFLIGEPTHERAQEPQLGRTRPDQCFPRRPRRLRTVRGHPGELRQR